MSASILTFLAELDSRVLLALNGLHNPVMDAVMITLTNKWLWISLSGVLLYFVFRHGGAKRGLLCVVCVGIALALSDQVCASVLRPAIERLRPSNPLNPISQWVHIVNDYRGGSYGFPSCHGATSMTIVVFLSLYFRNRKATLLLAAWSVMLCYTRIYLGVHYPGDILVGMMIGTLSALVSFSLYRALLRLRLPHYHAPLSPE